MAEMIGRQLGQYKIIEAIGQGGMATVYLAEQSAIRRKVAIKVIKPDLANEEFTKRFEVEAQLIARLSHPHILKVFDFGREDDFAYLVMELLTGGSLINLIRKSPPGMMPFPTIIKVIDEIADALEYAHERMIVHRDLKPQNVLLDENGNAFLTDFGIAKLLDQQGTILTQTGAILGTPAYIAPELWQGDAVDRRADVYALGIMLYEMLTGRVPFIADTAYNLMFMHVNQMPAPLITFRPDAPSELNLILSRALAKQREDRYLSTLELAADLRKALGDTSEPATFAQVVDDRGQVISPREGGTVTLPPTGEVPATKTDLRDSSVESDITAIPGELRTYNLTIDPAQLAAQEQQALARIDSEIRKRTPVGAVRPRFINPLPPDAGDRFRDRMRPQAEIVNFLLDDQTRLVSVYGRAGVGKTAVAARVLGNLQKARGADAFAGMVSLTAKAGAEGISIERILADFLQLLDGERAEAVQSALENAALSVTDKANALLKGLAGGRYILLLDNVEMIQNAQTGELNDPDLKAFLETLVLTGGLRVLVTSREPLVLSRAAKAFERLVPLEDGLPVEDAVDVLRALDPDGVAGLRDADKEQLTALATALRGFPRALEAAAGLLIEDPLITIEDLLQDVSAMSGEITDGLVQQALSRLTPEAMRVMEGLSIYQKPVTQVGLEYLLAPHLPTGELRGLLARLIRGHFASYNRANQTYAIHRIDREYCYRRIAAGQPNDREARTPRYTRAGLHHRAAEYYLKVRKPEEEWRRLDDLSAMLSEIEHRSLSGNFDESARVLAVIDRAYLFQWGFYRLALEQHQALQGKIADPATQTRQERTLGASYFNLRRITEALAAYERALSIARDLKDQFGEAGALNSMALVYQEQGEYQRAIRVGEQALALMRTLGNREIEGLILHNLSIYYGNLGQTERALEVDQQALEIARETEDSYGEGLAYAHLAELYSDLERYPEALESAKNALNIGGDENSPEIVQIAYYITALTQLLRGELSAARESAEQAAQSNYPPNNHNVYGLLGVIAVRQENLIRAKEVFNQVLSIQKEGEVSTEDLPDAVGLAAAGLVVCGDLNQLGVSAQNYSVAREADGEGETPRILRKRSARLLQALEKSDFNRVLTPVKAIFGE
jgi:serine/threonine protein kinase/tetratricopeptide (TPR) repeat protein